MQFAPAKRPRLTAPELTADPGDPREVHVCFGVKQWNSSRWLNGLDGAALKDYKEFLATERNQDRQIQGTLERIEEFRVLKAIADNWERRTQAVRQYLGDVVTAELAHYKKGEWLGIVRTASRTHEEL